MRAIRQILDQARRRDYTVKVYPNAPVNARHDLMDVSPALPFTPYHLRFTRLSSAMATAGRIAVLVAK